MSKARLCSPDANVVVSIIVTVISAPIVEEVTFRGFMYGQLKGGMPMFAAMLISSWVFGMVHGDSFGLCTHSCSV